MNLRQKIKKAKVEMKRLEKEICSSSWDVYTQFKKKADLQNIINKKRKFNQYTSDESLLIGRKITYMELSCGVTKLSVMGNSNGKPLSREQKLSFLNNLFENLLNHAPVVYERYKDQERLPDDFHVLYSIYYSVDRTRSKRLVSKLYIYQFKGNKNLYILEDGTWNRLTNFV